MTTPAHRRPFRRYTALLLLAAAALLLPVAALNLYVDPFAQFRVVDKPAFDGFRPDVDTRTWKAETLLRGDWDVAILGDSVAEIGFDPKSPEWKGARVLNAALPGANMYELRHVVNAVARRGNVRRLFLVANTGEWNEIHTTRHDFDKSRFNPELSLPDHWLEGLLGLRATESSLETLRATRRGDDQLFSPLGLRSTVSTGKALRGHRWMFDDRAKQSLRAPRGTPILAPSRLPIFREVLDTCRREGIELTVVIPPTHAVSLEIFFLLDRFTAYEDLKRGIARTIQEEAAAHPGKSPFPLWDFSGYNELTMEPIPAAADKTTRMRWFWEQDHITKELGEVVLRRIGGAAEPADFGVLITPENLEEHLAAIRRARAEYLRRHPEEIAHLEQLHGSVAVPATPRR